MAKNFNYGNVASVSRRRIKFPDNWEVKTTMSVGKLYPIKWQEVLPGDDFSEDLSFVSRLTSTYIRPVYENLQLSVYAFFLPGRILYDDYERVFGNPNPSAYTDNELGQIPCFTNPFTVTSGTVADYLELPVGRIAPNGNVSVLPFRAFAMIYNHWFRDQNNVDEIFVQRGEVSSSESPNNNPWSPNNYCGQLPSVKKYPDYFTTAVPQPQKGAPISLPVVGFADVPVVTKQANLNAADMNKYALAFREYDGSGNWVNGTASGSIGLAGTPNGLAAARRTGASTPTPINGSVVPSNLYAQTSDLSTQSVTVDEFRLAMQRQLMLVADTMYGSRYREYLLGHYGVNMKDDRAQVPEFLCGKSIPLAQQQVAQTTQNTDDKIGVGNLSSYSYTASRSGRYFKGFVEHGYVFWVGCLRYKHTYQQGVAKKWTRKVRDDFFDPLYSHIGYQPIYSSELYAVNPSDSISEPVKGDKIFGYQEAWSEYKHTPSVITGQARSAATNSLDVYHFGDNYTNAPVIGKQFVEETPTFVNRTLAVPSTTQDTFIFDFYCKSTKTRVMPLNCEPGYADHWFK